MSKLIEMLDRTQSVSEGIGFGASRRRAATPSVVVIGRTTAGALADDPGLAAHSADAALVALDASDGAAVARVGAALKGTLWGARVGSVSAADAKGLREAGCDFIVFDAEDTEAAVLNDREIGKILAHDPQAPDFDEEAVKAIRTLDIDGALLTLQDGLLPLTVQRLLDVQAARAPVGRRTLLTAPAELGGPEIESLRNAGVMGLVASLARGDDLRRMRAEIAGLPRRRAPGSGGGSAARAPAAGFARQAAGAGDDGDDYDDE